MSKVITFALAMALAGMAQATPPAKTSKTAPNTTQVNNTSATTNPAGASNAAPAQGNGNMVCLKGQNGTTGKCFPRPTKTVQR